LAKSGWYKNQICLIRLTITVTISGGFFAIVNPKLNHFLSGQTNDDKLLPTQMTNGTVKIATIGRVATKSQACGHLTSVIEDYALWPHT
jgi:hypothetical protein